MQRVLLAGALLLTGVLAMAADRFADSFDTEASLANWQFIDAKNWELRKDGDNQVLALPKPCPLRDGLRRPAEYALIKDGVWRDVTLNAKIQSLRPNTLKGRDVCLIFGWQDDLHFYYAHICSEANGSVHNVIMKVDGDKRGMIQTPAKPPVKLTDGWHDARVIHKADGTIQVFVDDMDEPFMTAKDTSYPQGKVGVGCFDDPALFDDVVVEGAKVGG